MPASGNSKLASRPPPLNGNSPPKIPQYPFLPTITPPPPQFGNIPHNPQTSSAFLLRLVRNALEDAAENSQFAPKPGGCQFHTLDCNTNWLEFKKISPFTGTCTETLQGTRVLHCLLLQGTELGHKVEAAAMASIAAKTKQNKKKPWTLFECSLQSLWPNNQVARIGWRAMSSSEGSVRNCEAGVIIFDAETWMHTRWHLWLPGYRWRPSRWWKILLAG